MLGELYALMASWILIAVSLVTSLLYLLVLFPAASRQYSGKSDPQITALQLAFSKERFTKVLRAWHKSRGAAAIPYFRRSIIRLDFIFPIIYATFFASVIATLTFDPGQEPDRVTYLLFLLPFLAGMFDWIENLLHLWILKGVDNLAEIEAVRPAPIFLASIAAAFKWALLLVSCLAIVVLVFSRLT